MFHVDPPSFVSSSMNVKKKKLLFLCFYKFKHSLLLLPQLDLHHAPTSPTLAYLGVKTSP